MTVKTAFVTGATGFIGAHVALLLLEGGWNVRALKREGSYAPLLARTAVEWRLGDLKYPASLIRAMDGCDAVFHIAADYRLWARHPQEIYDNNIGGTVNVMNAALQLGVQKVVYTSSVGALGLNADGTPADEYTPVTLEDMVGHYKRSKFLAEREVEKFVEHGLPVVLVHPSTPVGPGDHKPTPTGKIIVDYLNRKMPAFVDTGLNLVDVRDVARGHLLAMEKGRIGGKYILGNRNLTLADIFGILEELSTIPAPKIRLPHTPIIWMAHVNHWLSSLTGMEPLIPLEGVKMARKFMFFDSSRAIRELGLPQTDVKTALADAVDWFRANGYASWDEGRRFCGRD